LTMRQATPTNIRDALARRRLDSLYQVEWRSIAEADPPAGSRVLLGDDDDLAQALGASCHAELGSLPADTTTVFLACLGPASDPLTSSLRLLTRLQACLAGQRLAAARLVILTRFAIATGSGDADLDLAHAPIWGLVRSAQTEHPDRQLVLVDLDHESQSLRRLAAALGTAEPQLALPGGKVLAS